MQNIKKVTAIGLSAAAVIIAMGCDPTVDRGQSKQPPIAPAGAPVQNTFDAVPAGGSKSALGKSRDAAVRVREKIQARDAEIGKMADDVFKTTPDQTPQASPPTKPTTPPNTSPTRP